MGGTFGMTQNYVSRVSGRSQSAGPGMTSMGPCGAQDWQPTGNIIQIDEAELAELHRMIEVLQDRIGQSEDRAKMLGSIREKDILKFIVKNSLTARGGAGGVKGKRGASSSNKELTIGNSVCPW